MKLEVKRSPAKVAWHVSYNGIIVDVQPTKKLAQDSANSLASKYL